MKEVYPKVLLVAMILLVAGIINIRFQTEEETKQIVQPIQKVVVIKKIYVRVPATKDSVSTDSTTILTLPKPASNPAKELNLYKKSRNLHKRGYIS